MTIPALSFQTIFGKEAEASAQAHGRVNLIGEHTDYCDGFALPTLISHGIEVEIASRDDGVINGASSEFGEEAAATGQIPADSWLRFVEGAIALINEKGANIDGLDIITNSTIPAGAGVSSSAAFEIALLRALSSLTGISLSANQMAKMGQIIEHKFIGTKCGIMDQMAVAHAKQGEALLLDCRTLETEIIALPQSMRLAVIHSGSKRKLSSSAYNERLGQTIEAAAIFGRDKLRDVSIDELARITDPLLQQRAHHVISENERVQSAHKALKAGDLQEMGALMTASHISLRDDYEVSSDALDKLVDVALSAGALGARLTGAGFGGCIVALLEDGKHDAQIKTILEKNEDAYLVDCQ